jgi:murein DD-endopeptidase MepM/ murein hydrolase activator NlpD
MQEYTVMIFRDHSSPVRRYKIAQDRLKRTVIAAGVVALLVVGVLVDWVRVRSDVSELDALRAETAQQRDQIAEFTTKMEQLDTRFARLNEFERKVRVIANLPAAVTEADGPPRGVGGGEEEDENSIVRDAVVPSAAQGDRAADRTPERPHALLWFDDLDDDASALLDATEAREHSLTDLVDALRGKADQLASTPSVWPAKGWVTSGFGRRISPFTGKPQAHLGLDIAAERGTQILAPARGRVIFVGRKGPLGKAVEIDHGFGIKTYFGHCDTFHVKKGQRVERGQWIASMGSTGRSTGPHLHYAVEVDGHLVDPRKYILD